LKKDLVEHKNMKNDPYDYESKFIKFELEISRLLDEISN